MDMSKDAEYAMLRTELLEWQNRRFSIVGMSVAVVTAFLGLAQLSDVNNAWVFTSSLLLLFLAIACLLTAYCGIVNLRIGTYLQVFHESPDSAFQWESRCFQLSGKAHKYGNLNKYLCAVYLSLAIISLIMPALLFGIFNQNLFMIAFLAISFIAFFAALVWLYKSQEARLRYLKKWEEVKNINNE